MRLIRHLVNKLTPDASQRLPRDVVVLGVIAFFVLYGVAGNLVSELDNVWLATLMDPFGLTALEREVRYWPAAERNSRLPELAPDLSFSGLTGPEGLPAGLGALTPRIPLHRCPVGFLSPLEQPALAAAYPEETWECSHLGGDRFAGTMNLLPHGLSYGRVPAGRAPAVARRTPTRSSTGSTSSGKKIGSDG